MKTEDTEALGTQQLNRARPKPNPVELFIALCAVIMLHNTVAQGGMV